MKSRSRAGFALVAVTVLAAAGASSSAAVAVGPEDPAAEVVDTGTISSQREPGDGANGLSARLADLSSPRLRGAGAAQQADQVSLARSSAGSLQRRGSDLIVQARTGGDPRSVVPALRQAGAEIIFVSDEYATIDLAASQDELRQLAAVPGVEYVAELLRPQTNGNASCGSVTSEADTQLKAALARSTYGVDGTGVKVGILSDSFDRSTKVSTDAKKDVKTGDLPGTDNKCGRKLDVEILEEGMSGGIDEGRAMAQLIHDVAPGASLMFAGPGNSEESMAQNILDLRDAGADVIVDDLTYLAEPAYQDGVLANAVTEVTGDGVVYFSSAANSNVIDSSGNEVGSYEALQYRPLPAASCAGLSTGTCMDFNPAAAEDSCLGFTIAANSSFSAVLQWAEPRSGVTTDFDLYAIDLDPTPDVVVDDSTSNNVTGGIPAELVNISNSTGATKSYCLLIHRFSGANTPRLKLFLGRAKIGSIQYAPGSGGDVFGPTIYSHNGTEAAMTTAAVPFNNSSTIETFSSRGPVTLTHGPVSGTTPAAPLASPEVLAKPDIAATDGGQTTFFLPVGGGISRFYGTSAAAPHAAAVAALQIQRNSTATVQQIKDGQTSTAVDVGGFPALAQGAGLIDAVAAVGALSAGPDIATDCLAAQAEYDKQLKKLAKLEKKKKTKQNKKKVKKQRKKVKQAKQAMEAACP